MLHKETEEGNGAVGLAGTLHVAASEFERARRRVGSAAWVEAVDALRESAERIHRADAPLPEMDTAWYDADPKRDFSETYVSFHAFIRPAVVLMDDARTLLYAGRILDDQRYSDRALKWLLHIAGEATFHVRHHDSGMEYARLSAPMAEIYSGLRSRLSEEDRGRIEEQLQRAAAAIQEGTGHWLGRLRHMPYSNHLGFHRYGLMAIGLALGRRDWIDEAIDGPRGFGEMIAGSTYDDGLCYESSVHYHFATFGALLGMAEMVRHAPNSGRDLYREIFANGRSLKQMFDAPLGLLLPSGELPPVGDCYARRGPFSRLHAKTYEIGYAVYSDPRYAWLLLRSPRESLNALLFGVDDLADGTPPGGATRHWPEHGYALLTAGDRADYWSPSNRAPAAFLSADRNGIHHHLDRLGLQVAGLGRLWLEDVESATVKRDGHGFVAPVQKGFNRTTLAHNLVMIDQENQRASDAMLELREFKDVPAVKTITYADPRGLLYDGVVQARSVSATPEYVLDVAWIASAGRERVCDLLLHPRADGPAETGGLVFNDDGSLPEDPPYAMLRHVESADLNGHTACVHLLWRQSDAACSVSISVIEGRVDRLYRAVWPIQSDWATGGREMFLLRALGARVCFVSLYQIREGDHGSEGAWRVVSAERLFNGKHDEIRVRTTNGDREQRHMLDGGGSV